MAAHREKMPDESGFRRARLPEFLRPIYCDDLIRLGGDHDGGYVVSRRMVEPAQFLLSFGLGDDWTFEAAVCDLIDAAAPICHVYDATTSHEFLRAIGSVPKITDYEALFDGQRAVHFKRNVGKRWGRNVVSFSQTLARIKSAGPVLLKMDIEGAEYPLLDDICRNADLFAGLVIEFHHLDLHQDDILSALLKLVVYFDVIHVHANNSDVVSANGLPAVVEITFMAKQPGEAIRYDENANYPVPGLDAPNSVDRSDISIVFEGTTAEIFQTRALTFADRRERCKTGRANVLAALARRALHAACSLMRRR
jgi:hypothetical protein